MAIAWIAIFCLGILSAGYLPQLPALPWLIPLLCPLLLFRWRPHWRALCLASVGLAGLAWGIGSGHMLLAGNLPAERGGEDFLARGVIVGLPQTDKRRTRFLMDLESVQPVDGPPLEPIPRRVQVSWYGHGELTSGDHWQLRLRLKPPRGFVNPGGFDYQAWLLRRGVDAAGYVRKDRRNQRLDAPPAPESIGARRQSLRRWLLDSSDSDHTGLLLALLIGDRSGIDTAQWQQLQSTGTNHLVAISGLHVGFVAMLGYGFGTVFGRLANWLWHRLPASVPAHAGAGLAALGYSALAGFSLPTQRALIMVLVVQWAWLRRRSFRPIQGLALALLAVVVLDPLASFDLGFWLSFGAVAVLLLAFTGRYPSRRPWPGSGLVRAQWVVFVGLLVPLGVLMHTGTLLAPVANLVAIPLVTLTVVPGLLLAAGLQTLWPALSALALAVAEWGIEALVLWLNGLTDLAGDGLSPLLVFSPAGLVLATLGALLMLAPRGIPGRWLGLPSLCVALLVPAPRPPPLTVSFLDVGQGLAAVVQTPGHSLVYDTGPAYSDRMEAGGAIVAPYLRRRNIERLDRLVVSHSHGDHSGGLPGLLAQVPVDQLVAGEPLVGELRKEPAVEQAMDCHEMPPWRWDGIDFRFLTWRGVEDEEGNNRSCVLLIEYAGERVLLTGDIERRAEWRLLGQGQLPEAVRVLQVPHHGSLSSSARVFVQHTRPQHAAVSAGYGSAHGHPNAEVTERYRQQGTRLWNTGEVGALEFSWYSETDLRVRRYRDYRKRYWYE